jgi:Flp pilus assembly protein TadD
VGLKRYDEAVSILERRLAELPPNRAAETHGLLAYAYARAGQFREARNSIATLRQLNGGRLPATGILAATLEESGDHEAAVALLGEAVAQHDVWLLQFNRSERYDKLRKDPRAAAMLASLEAR